MRSFPLSQSPPWAFRTSAFVAKNPTTALPSYRSIRSPPFRMSPFATGRTRAISRLASPCRTRRSRCITYMCRRRICRRCREKSEVRTQTQLRRRNEPTLLRYRGKKINNTTNKTTLRFARRSQHCSVARRCVGSRKNATRSLAHS